MVWQDTAFTLGQIVLAANTLPILYHKTSRVPVLTSGLTAGVLYAFVPVYLSLGFFWAAALCVADASVWTLVVLFRHPNHMADQRSAADRKVDVALDSTDE